MPPPSSTDHLPPSHPATRQRPKSPTRVLAETEAQWLFSEAELANTPSIQDGMSQSEERANRSKGINFIVQVGIMLKLPQTTLSTAAIYFQRFLMRASLKKERNGIPKIKLLVIAATALFLATKVEESSRKIKDMIMAFGRVAKKDPNAIIDDATKEFWHWKQSILNNEDVYLETLCFDLTVESPQRHLHDMLKYYRLENNKRVRNAAWSFVTDSSQTQLCLLVNSRTIAVASLYAACKHCDIALPDDAKGRSWWDAQRARLRDVRRAVDYMCAIYDPDSKLKDGVKGPNGGSGGASSIYLGLSTPTNGAVNGWDSTRLKEDGSQDARSPHLEPHDLVRRASNASSIGVKRDREYADDSLPAINGVKNADVENKRPRLEVAPGTNGSKEPTPTVMDGTLDTKQREEALRIEHSNKQEVANVQAVEQEEAAAVGLTDPSKAQVNTPATAYKPEVNGNDSATRELPAITADVPAKEMAEEGSEEGEVEE